jgi:cold shock CspA family protein/uncharacterized LabA/DUF88 family protein
MLTKIAVFYDGGYFSSVSSYYLYQHKKKSRIAISGLHDFIKYQVSSKLGLNEKLCHVDAHYFRGRYSTHQVLEHSEDGLYKDRIWEDVLLKENVQTHYMPISNYGDEKGIDVWLALQALEGAYLKQYDVLVLIAGDSDYVPLIRKINNLGIPTMCLGFSFQFMADGVEKGTIASQQLLSESIFPLEMQNIVDGESQNDDEHDLIDNMFIRRREEYEPVQKNDGWLSGVIVSLKEGYGFIRPDAGGDNLFFHHSNVENKEFADLDFDMAVKYQEGVGQQGKICAVKVKVEY